MFDAIIKQNNAANSRLSEIAWIVENPAFEAAIIKVQNKDEDTLITSERCAIMHLKLQNKNDNNLECFQSQTTLSFAQRALKKMKIAQSQNKTSYIELRFILPNTNVCERIFSVAGHAMSDRRKRILPSNFECQLFLNFNHRLWGLKEISEIVHWMQCLSNLR